MIRRLDVRRLVLLMTVAAGLLIAPGAAAQNAPQAAAKPLPFVSPIFGDDMVLQRCKENTIWGWSEPGDNVRVEIAGVSASGVAGADRRWQVKIKPPAPGSLQGQNQWTRNSRASQRSGG